MKIVYIYYGDHYLFDSWAKGVGAKKYPFIPKWLFNFKRLRKNDGSLSYRISNFIRKRPIIMQFLSLLNSFIIPKADVYLLENMACVSSIYIKSTKKSKVILFNGDQFFKDYPKSSDFKKNISKKFFRKIDGVFSISFLYQDICKKYLKRPNKMVYPYFNKNMYSKYKADQSSKNICFLGYLVKLKGLDHLINAFLKLDKKYKDKLYLIGSPVDDFPALKDPKKNKNIIVTGWADNPPEYMKKCGIYVNPAHKESFGINVLEAMSMGMVTLVSHNCGVAEIVKTIDKRLIIDTDEDDIVKKIKWLQDNKTIMKKIASKGIKLSSIYTKEKSVSEFKEGFAKMMKEI